MLETYYSVKEVEGILKRSSRTIYAYIKAGLLKARKLKTTDGRGKLLISESDLKAFIENGIPAGYYQELYPRPHKGEKVEK